MKINCPKCQEEVTRIDEHVTGWAKGRTHYLCGG